MKNLHELVIPKIFTEWKEVARSLCYSQEAIEKMDKDSLKVYPMQCCEDLFRDWLCSDDSMSPRSWKVLINSLKQVQQLMKSAKQIEKDVQSIIR